VNEPDQEFDWKECNLYRLEEMEEIPVPEIKYPDADVSEILSPNYIKDTFLDLCLGLR